MEEIILGLGGFGYEIIFDIIFTIITLVVSLNAFKVYKLSDNKKSLLFGMSFLSLSVAYFIESLFNFLIISKLNQNIYTTLKITSIYKFNMLAMYAHMLFFTTAVVILVYMTFKNPTFKQLVLLLLISLFAILFSCNKLILFYLFSSIYLLYVILYYYNIYKKYKIKQTLLVLLAFVLLFLTNVHFIFVMNSEFHELLYFIGLFLELMAYFLILINLIVVLKNGKKR